MKILYNVIITFLLLHKFNSQFEGECEREEESNIVESINQIDPDKTLERIRDYMWNLADNISSETNLLTKKKNIGILPDEYPENMKEKAKKIRQDRSRWEQVMLFPTSIWRLCVFPNFKISYHSWCNQKMSFSCKNNFCLVCCDHLALHYKEVTENTIIGGKLMNQENIDFVVTDSEINTCRAACERQYPVEKGVVLPSPPRDINLGKSEHNAALSCADIKKWGDENSKSGSYWIEVSTKGKQKVYCDMHTDGGGWTLFYNYIHLPGQSLILDASKLPINLSENSHSYLTNAGFSPQDVKELRFFCKEKFKGEKVYWHFKTSNKQFIALALNSSQEGFKFSSLAKSYKELPPPEGNYKKRVYTRMIQDVELFNVSEEGGFAYTPFGLTKYKAFWTIRGPSITNQKFECATSHPWVGGYAAPNDSPNMVESHHTIWFRGDPANEETVQRRLIARLRNAPS